MGVFLTPQNRRCMHIVLFAGFAITLPFSEKLSYSKFIFKKVNTVHFYTQREKNAFTTA
jgi:hypothetical protein